MMNSNLGLKIYIAIEISYFEEKKDFKSNWSFANIATCIIRKIEEPIYLTTL